MRFFQPSLTSVAFIASALIAGCSSDAPTPATGTPAGGGSSGTSAVPGGGAPAGSSAGSTATSGGKGGGSSSAGAGPTGTGGTSPGGGGTSPSSGGTTVTGSGGVSSSPAGAAGVTASAGAGADLDMNKKANAKPGDQTTVVQDYLRMGEIRLLNNNWGSQALNCTAPKSTMSVFVNADKSFGWTFDRGDCDTAGSNSSPDFPQLEFGIHPFGLGSSLATSPNFSSTTLLPLQIKNITSASVTLDGLSISLDGTNNKSWDLTFEFWLAQQNPATTQNDAGVYSELMTFWGWQDGRYPEPPNGTGPKGTGAGDSVQAGTKTYKLELQDDNWSNGKWRYFQFRTTDGPLKNFSGTVDVKKLIDYLVSKGYSQDLWVARLEVGSEIDDLTKGTVTMKNVTFEVNGQMRSPVFSQ